MIDTSTTLNLMFPLKVSIINKSKEEHPVCVRHSCDYDTLMDFSKHHRNHAAKEYRALSGILSLQINKNIELIMKFTL